MLRALMIVHAFVLPGLLFAQQPDPAPQPLLSLPTAAARGKAARAEHPALSPLLQLGLDWLQKHQDADGRWNSDDFMQHDGEQPTDGAGNAGYDVALTGLSLLALAREGPASAKDARGQALQRGAAWLATQQSNKGLLGGTAAQDFIYGHAMGTLGLCATFAATGDAATKDPAQHALEYLDRHRNPYAVWRYQPRDNDNDSSVTTWATMAVLAGVETELRVNSHALRFVGMWFDQVTDPDGRAGYSKVGEASSRKVGDHATRFPPEHGEAMTAAMLLCRGGCGFTKKTHPALNKSVALLLGKPPAWDAEAGQIDLCYWLFATEGLRRVDPAAHATWGKALVDALTKGQRSDSTFAGSWDPIDPWGENGGRIYSTALAVLALQSCYPVAATK